MKRIIFILMIVLLLPAFVFSGGDSEKAASSGGVRLEGPTVVNPMGITTDYLNQLELAEFEAQAGKALVFSGNPLFAGQGLPAVADRCKPGHPIDPGGAPASRPLADG